MDLRVQGFLQRVEGEPRQHAYGAGYVVTAGMTRTTVRPQTGERIVLRQDSHLVCIVFAFRQPDGPERVVDAGEFAFDGEAFFFQQRANSCAAFLLMTRDLRVIAQPCRQIAAVLLVLFQFFFKDLFFLFVVHR